MTKSFLKKAMTVVGAALLALPLALNANIVSAAEGDTATTPTQNITLTKYAYTKGDTHPDNTSEDIFKGPDDPDANKRLSDVTFNVYNVTDQYWADPSAFKDDEGNIKADDFATDGLTPVKMTTDANGQATHDFDVFTKDKTSVYVFEEIEGTTNKGYTLQPKLAISLPQGDKQADDTYQNLYVFPKNTSEDTLDIQFTKIDGTTEKPLAGAKFAIKNADGLFATFYKDGQPVAEVTEWSADPSDVVWTKDQQTTFVSDSEGIVGFTSYLESKQGADIHGIAKDGKYTAVEIEAPKGYEQPAADAAETVVPEDDNTKTVKNTPEGILPHTGGAGIVAFVVLGAALLTFGIVAYNKRRASF
ncbi:pilin N-terminal domain-containing protein [Lacticaseibacillus kribbianus]|uniref:pilin N-terminal domain-containing protein n=1 Tax=Lacticaseibacillus kribbianus TaxID=2926292 RepID=UPI001CD2E34B|nr:pilin N-terminal domain-containing protein [Lacticaseibacillus kribbianus]